MSSIWLKTDVSQIEGGESRLAGPGACLKNIIHRMRPPVEGPGGAHSADFMGRDWEVRPMTVGEPDACRDPSSHRLGRRRAPPPDFTEQTFLGNQTAGELNVATQHADRTEKPI